MTELIEEASYLISKIHEKETSMRPSKTVAKEQMKKGAPKEKVFKPMGREVEELSMGKDT